MSLLPLGLLSQGGGAAGFAFELISTAVGTGSSGVITFSAIPATYKHLQLRVTMRTDNAAATNTASVTFNSDTAANYSSHKFGSVNASTVSSGLASQSNMALYTLPGNTLTTGAFSASVLEIVDYADTNKYKTVRLMTGFSTLTPNEVSLHSGSWRSTSAVTSLTITAGTGSFLTASRFSLYGIRGA
jgi:hypothetical protein